jgi:hypothetical protein
LRLYLSLDIKIPDQRWVGSSSSPTRPRPQLKLSLPDQTKHAHPEPGIIYAVTRFGSVRGFPWRYNHLHFFC